MLGLGGGCNKRAGILFDQTQRTAKRDGLDLEEVLGVVMGLRGIGQFVLAIDGGGCGDPNAEQQDEQRRRKANPLSSAHPASKNHDHQSHKLRACATLSDAFRDWAIRNPEGGLNIPNSEYIPNDHCVKQDRQGLGDSRIWL